MSDKASPREDAPRRNRLLGETGRRASQICVPKKSDD